MENNLNEGIKFQNATISNIEEKSKELINLYRQIVSNKIIELINEETRGINESTINDWLNEYFIDEITSNINSKNSQIEEKLCIALKNLSNNKNISQYVKSLEEIVKNENSDWIENITNNFLHEIITKIYYYSGSYFEINELEISTKIDNFKYELKKQLETGNEQFIEEYKSIIIKAFNENKKNINNNLNNNKQQIISEEELNMISKYFKYCNYELTREGNELYIINIKNKKKIKTNLHKQKNGLISFEYKDKDVDFEFKFHNNSLNYIDKNKNEITLINNNNFIKAKQNEKIQMAIQKTSKGYIFHHDNKELTKIEEIDGLIHKLKLTSPKYYEELLKDQNFKKIIDDIEKNNEKRKDIYVDTDGKVKISPEHKTKVIEKFKLCGYDIIEKEDGVYAKNISTGEENKIRISSGRCQFENKNPKEFSLATIVDLMSETSISTGHMMYNAGENSIYSNEDLEHFMIRINDYTFTLSIKGNEIKCTAKNKNNIPLELNQEEMIKIIKQTFPELIKYIEIKKIKNEVITEAIKNIQENQKENHEEINHNPHKKI